MLEFTDASDRGTALGTAAVALGALCCVAQSSCDLDSRFLHPPRAADLAGAAGADYGGAGGQGGQGGEGGASVEPEGADLDDNGIDDRLETIVKNPGFDRNADQWELEPFSGRGWSRRDALGRTASGSMSVSNILAATDDSGTAVTGSHQCVRVRGGDSYGLWASVFIGSGFGTTGASARVRFFTGTSCDAAKEVGRAQESNTVSRTEVWQQLTLVVAAPEAAGSAELQLRVKKPMAEGSVESLFDEILFKPL